MENIEIKLLVIFFWIIPILTLVGFILKNLYDMYKDRKDKAEQLVKPVKNQVSCNACKCLINEEAAFKVYVTYDSRYIFPNDEVYYCHSCKPAYSSKIFDKYFKELEVTEQGEPVGYIKRK